MNREPETRAPEQPPQPAGPAEHENAPLNDAALPPRPGTEEQLTPRPWTRKRAAFTGAIVGAFFGTIFFAAYSGVAAWICSSRLDCGHWVPIVVVFVIGAVSSTVIGAAAGMVLHKLYNLFKVT